MFPVELKIVDEHTLAEQVETMRCWLDHQRFEPVGLSLFVRILSGPIRCRFRQ